MGTILEKLWNWGHLAGSHNKCVGCECSMSPVEFGEEYGIKNSFIVSYGGNIQPPYGELAKSMDSLRQIKWSVLGDASTPLPEAELGNTEDVIAAAAVAENITGAVVDDFFSPKRVARFTPEVLGKMKKALNDKGLDFWCVLYAHELEELDLTQYLPCFDGVTFWIWKGSDIVHMEAYLEKLKSLTGDMPVMLGIYLWNYGEQSPMDPGLFQKQLSYYFDLTERGEIQGVIFCSNTIGDADLETNRILKAYIREVGHREVLA